jgi:hypothetical protein
MGSQVTPDVVRQQYARREYEPAEMDVIEVSERHRLQWWRLVSEFLLKEERPERARCAAGKDV